MIKETNLIFDGPHKGCYGNFDFYSSGCSPYLLEHILNFIEQKKFELKEVSIALYLFNNKILFEKLKNLSEMGVVINIISIPLEGYDVKTAKKIINSQRVPEYENVSKLDLAKEVYYEASNTNENFHFYFYDHVYLRSNKVKNFSRGKAPYSMHIKSFFFELKDASSYICLSSSNFVVRDLVKEELLFTFKNDESTHKSFKLFFKALLLNSTLKNNYQVKNILSKSHLQTPEESNNRITNFYTAPFFYKSPINARGYIGRIIRDAKHHVYIVAQHVTEFMNELISIKDQNIDINILSQTYIDNSFCKKGTWDDYVTINGVDHKCRAPSNTQKFLEFVNSFQEKNIGNYYFNVNVHLKFIVVDNTIIISTGNFTETQFTFDPRVEIDKFINIPDAKYSGTFAEVNQYIFLDNIESLANKLIQHFKKITSLKDTFQAVTKK